MRLEKTNLAIYRSEVAGREREKRELSCQVGEFAEEYRARFIFVCMGDKILYRGARYTYIYIMHNTRTSEYFLYTRAI